MPALAFLRRMVGGRGVCVAQTCTDARSACKAAHVGTMRPTSRSKWLRRCAFLTCAVVQPSTLRSQAALGAGVLPASCVLVPKRDACAFLAQQEKPEVLPVAGIMQKEISIFSFIPDLKFCLSAVGFCSRYISRYVNLKLGFLPFVVASIVAMVFLRRICSLRPGDGEQRGQSLAALTACDWGLYCFQPQRMAACLTCRLDVVCPSRLGGMMQPAKAAHGAFLARRKLAASGSSRAPCAFPKLRCDPRC